MKICTASTILTAFAHFPFPSLSTYLFFRKATYSLAPQVPETDSCNVACVHKFGRGDFILCSSAEISAGLGQWREGQQGDPYVSSNKTDGKELILGMQGTVWEVEP